MWFAKWFGGRSDQDEPARHAPVAPRSSAPAKRAQAVGSGAKAGKQDKSGFDPYNSGSFDKSKAWERVLR